MKIRVLILATIGLANCSEGGRIDPSFANNSDAGYSSSVVASDSPPDDVDLNQTLDTATNVLDLASAALGVASAASGGSYGGGGGARSAGTNRPTTSGGGYSQVGAFRDCQQMYSAAGMSNLAAQCATRASNMGSIR